MAPKIQFHVLGIARRFFAMERIFVMPAQGKIAIRVRLNAGVVLSMAVGAGMALVQFLAAEEHKLGHVQIHLLPAVDLVAQDQVHKAVILNLVLIAQ
jgi:hypothetical protein